jgi:hypothetical protein
MRRRVGALVGVVVAAILVASGIRFSAYQATRLAAARAEAAASAAQADSAVKQAEVSRERADSLRAEAEAEHAQSLAARHQAETLDREVTRLKVAFREAAAAAPDTCAEVIARASNLLVTADSVDAARKAALVAAGRAFVTLASAYDSLAIANSNLRASIVRLSADTKTLVRVSKPSLLTRLLPQPHVGITAGIDIQGRPTAVIGIGAGWRF